MRKPLWIVIIFLAALLAFSISYIAFYDMPGMVKEIKGLKTEVKAQGEMLKDQNFDLTALSIKNQHLRLDIAELELEIMTLRAEGMAYDDMISILEYCITYIHYLQVRMQENNINYPEFIIKNILDELIVEGVSE